MAAASASRKLGDINAALRNYLQAERIAIASSNPDDQSGALIGEASCYLRLFRYRDALEASEKAFTAANLARDDTRAGAAAGNKAAVYDQVGDGESASVAAEESVKLLEHSPRRDYYAQALLSDGAIEGELNRHALSLNLFRRAIAVAQEAKLPDTEALADDHLGYALMMDGNYILGRHFLEEARRIRIENHDAKLILTQAHLADLDLRTGDLGNALKLIEEVLQPGANQDRTLVPYFAPLLKGQILLAMGRPDDALSYFANAVQLADDWRENVLPSQTTGTQTDAKLADIYDEYIQQAAALASDRHDRALARKALTVLIAHRAWTLREQLLATRQREMRLPPRYSDLLSQLQSAQAVVTLARIGPTQQRNKEKLARIRAELTDLENKIGIQRQNISLSREKDGYRTSLRDIQLHLAQGDLLLSFYVGPRRAFLWALTSDQVKLYRLPASDDITRQVRAFKDAVRSNALAGQAGTNLSRSLFSQLPPAIAAKRNWLIAADGALLDGVPFAALPSPDAAPLIAAHTIRMLPSEALLDSPRSERTRPLFVGIADPIYNLADARRRPGLAILPVSRQPQAFSLGRLVASDREVRSAAAAVGLPAVEILTGEAASAARISQAISGRPQILHFAVHVITPASSSGESANDSEQAALALTLTNDNMPELLTREGIAALRVPGSLVVLSGCSSQQGAVLRSAGLVGLSRAWLLAGASAVLVTNWPTPDDSGTFFRVFYDRFHTAPGSLAQRAAAALQQTQSEMRAGSGYRSNAAFWSAYSLISKE